ncbi:uncharacterized protein LOC131657578 [Vicia villosa]|uniref:uncharacterized protein LOC131657578 n=1 Tax=Vicia villosa TaxID=3911 RepID=UPI00273A9DD8|nr:uncharacterized protein LOC131657578 [Vicia villosa]
MDLQLFPPNFLSSLNLHVFATNHRPLNLPNLWCICSKDLSPQIIHCSDQFVAFSLVIDNSCVFIASVYASTNAINRKLLWADLSSLLVNHPAPWCFLGDFNAILGAHEHRGRISPSRSSISDFRDWFNLHCLSDLPTKGPFFTWLNGRNGIHLVERRLDRVLCNQAWITRCFSSHAFTLPKIRSDHFPICLEASFSHICFKSNFRFLNMWTSHDTCKALVADCWSQPVFGCPMFILSHKLKLLKGKLKIWNKEVFGDIHKLVQTSTTLLNHIQEQIHLIGMTDSLKAQEVKAQIDLEDALVKEELYWMEKARVRWHKQGDRNTAYFHRISKIKRSKNTISSLRNGDLLILDPEDMAAHAVSYFTNIFGFAGTVQDNAITDIIPSLVSETMNATLTAIPSVDEIKAAVFGLRKDSAPGPDGFGGVFFHTYWNIISNDVCNAVWQFFKEGWIPQNYNANLIILIPKSKDADSMENFRPIALANFKFKIISKIIAGRNIKDCLCLASEIANLLDKKTVGGNVVLKVDITKAFDTINWSFLLKVLKRYGFNNTFCHWISTILDSAYMSVAFNGSIHGYFPCKRGVRQGDPLSPLLFCLAEDVLSRHISSLVSTGKLLPMKATKNLCIPSHILYADDILICCKGKSSNITALQHLFHNYSVASGQYVNTAKSFIYCGAMDNNRATHLSSLTGFSKGSLPFRYLGVPIFKGRVKRAHFQDLADSMISKMAAWKGSLLSYAGRITLPVSLLKDIEQASRNFIWSGSTTSKKLVTVAWNKVCQPKSHGGLGLRSLITLNNASNLKLGWDLINSEENWACLLRARVLRNFGYIRHHIFSTVWSSIKPEIQCLYSNTAWSIGNGSRIKFWTDAWCGPPLIEKTQLHVLVLNGIDPHIRICDLLNNGSWNIPILWYNLFPFIPQHISHVLPHVSLPDFLVWPSSCDGTLSLKDAYKFKASPSIKLPWPAIVWHNDIAPSKSFLVWRLIHGKIPTDEAFQSRGFSLCSRCSLCNLQSESTSHIFFHCRFAVRIWKWLCCMINCPINIHSMDSVWNLCRSSTSPQGMLVISAAIVSVLSFIWLARNGARYRNITPSFHSTVSGILAQIRLAGNCSVLRASSSMSDFCLLKSFKISVNFPRAPRVIEFLWHPPIQSWIKCNCDGSLANSASGCGGIFRDSLGNFVLAFAEPVAELNSLDAEFSAVFRAIEIARDRAWLKLWIECDSLIVVQAFSKEVLIPWQFRDREGNSCADFFANLGRNSLSLTLFDAIPIGIRCDFASNPSIAFLMGMFAEFWEMEILLNSGPTIGVVRIDLGIVSGIPPWPRALCNQDLVHYDVMVRPRCSSGPLCLKDAFNIKAPISCERSWAKSIWSSDIPPSKFILAWKLILRRVPTDDLFLAHRISLASMCPICKKAPESIMHLFSSCRFASSLWNWFFKIAKFTAIPNTFEEILQLCNSGFSKHCLLVLRAAAVFVIWNIWLFRNLCIYKNIAPNVRVSISNIQAQIALSGNNSNLTSFSSMQEFSILKAFKVSIRPPPVLVPKEVLWKPPILDWVKGNCDGAFDSNGPASACGGVFRNNYGDFLLAFAENLSMPYWFHVELCGAIRVIFIAEQRGWSKLWLKTDSSLVVQAYSNPSIVLLHRCTFVSFRILV